VLKGCDAVGGPTRFNITRFLSVPAPHLLQALKQTLLQQLKAQAPADVSLAPPGTRNRSHEETTSISQPLQTSV
jgi:hypothetical protein